MCGFVVTVGGGRERLGLEKNGKKRSIRVEGAGCWCGQAAYAVRQVKRMCDSLCLLPPHALPVWVGGRGCFSRHHV